MELSTLSTISGYNSHEYVSFKFEKTLFKEKSTQKHEPFQSWFFCKCKKTVQENNARK